jgi:uncharacterized protein
MGCDNGRPASTFTHMVSRRRALRLLGALAWAPGVVATTPQRSGMFVNPLRIRTLTAGVTATRPGELATFEAAIGFLAAARRAFEDAGYEVQTTRIATTPLHRVLDAQQRRQSIVELQALDRMAQEANVLVSIGPVKMDDQSDGSLAGWADELVRATRVISFSVNVASAGHVLAAGAASAAHVMTVLARSQPDGVANFRFAAAANIPAGTPFFPVAWHNGGDSFAIGLESAGLVTEAFGAARDAADAGERLKAELDRKLGPIEELAMQVAAGAGRMYLGIDTSPAPGMDRSIGEAIEALTKAPFGSAGTLEACSAVTAAVKAVRVRTCGYSGLMLPVLEDPVLARRAGEGRYGVRDLLLCSSVCGTGLDVVPIPGDTPVAVVERLLRDVAALSNRLHKPLSARLFIVPGKKAGDVARFNDKLLTDCIVMRVD